MAGVERTAPTARRVSRRGALLGSVALVAGVLACAADDAGARPTHWDYDADGPGAWPALDHDYLACGTGREQSPIDLPGHERIDAAAGIAVGYGSAVPVELRNNGHTVQAQLPAGNGNRLVVDGTPFELSQFHFHLPSEHTIDGDSSAMELHLVHRSAAGQVAVLGVLLRPEAGARRFDPIFTTLPSATGDSVPGVGPIDPATLLPTRRDQFRYRGSLTTPPCTEGVSWIVFDTPVAVSPAQVDAYRSLFAHSNRPTQPRNGRPVVHAGG
ncbi:carbonic anhydrase [Nocardia rhizosphaerae]|uniref:carbonic anhydrase n=1 Tax=Nocardia rhizosphaerae TaxID=1691571 RepID=A0ABV8L714_9NOCA